MVSDPQRSDDGPYTKAEKAKNVQDKPPRTMTMPVHIKIGTFGIRPALAAGLGFEHDPLTRYRFVQVLLCPSTTWEAVPVRMKASTFILFAAALRASLKTPGGWGTGEPFVELEDEQDPDLYNRIKIARHSDYFYVTATLQNAHVGIPFWVTEVLLSVIEIRNPACKISKE